MAISAGTSAAVQMALRHPQRVRHLVLSSGNFPGSATAQAPPAWATVFYSDPAMWLMKVLARPMFAQLMGVPAGFPRSPEDAAVMDRMLESIFPIGPRVAGAVLDAYRTNPEITQYPLEAMQVPTLDKPHGCAARLKRSWRARHHREDARSRALERTGEGHALGGLVYWRDDRAVLAAVDLPAAVVVAVVGR